MFRYGNGQWSKYFRDMSEREKRFSHVGIVVGDQSELAVVHSSADDWTGIGSVRRESITSFIDGYDDFVVYRVKCTDAERREIADTALAYVGKPFDARFDLSTSNRVYCTELVRIAVNGVLKEEAVTTTKIKGKVFVATDDCYLGLRFVKVYDRIQDAEQDNAPDRVRVGASRPPAPDR